MKIAVIVFKLNHKRALTRLLALSDSCMNEKRAELENMSCAGGNQTVSGYGLLYYFFSAGKCRSLN